MKSTLPYPPANSGSDYSFPTNSRACQTDTRPTVGTFRVMRRLLVGLRAPSQIHTMMSLVEQSCVPGLVLTPRTMLTFWSIWKHRMALSTLPKLCHGAVVSYESVSPAPERHCLQISLSMAIELNCMVSCLLRSISSTDPSPCCMEVRRRRGLTWLQSRHW